MEGEAEGLIAALRGSGAEAIERDGSLPEGSVDLAFAGDGGGDGGALEAGVEHESEGAEVLVGEGDVEVAAGVVEGEADGLGLGDEGCGEKQRDEEDEEALPGLHGFYGTWCGRNGSWQTLPIEVRI